MSSDPNKRDLHQTKARLRIRSLILDDISRSLIALVFTCLVLFAVYEGYQSLNGTIYFTWIVRTFFVVFFAALVVVLIVLAINVVSFLLRGVSRSVRETAKNVAGAIEEVNPEFHAKRISAKLLEDYHRRGELPPRNVVDAPKQIEERNP